MNYFRTPLHVTEDLNDKIGTVATHNYSPTLYAELVSVGVKYCTFRTVAHPNPKNIDGSNKIGMKFKTPTFIARNIFFS